MRIRKCASRILGSATSAYYPPPPPPLPPPAVQFCASSSALPAPAGEVRESQASGGAAAVPLGIVCSLNRSPWDLMSPDLDYFQDFVGGDGEDQQTTIFVNKMNIEGRIGPPPPSTFVREKKEKRNLSLDQKPKAKTKDDQATDLPKNKTYISCKKNDGKGWHCKRLAEHPNNLCNYHLSQVRSYGGGSSRAATPPAAAVAPPPAGTSSSSAAAKGQAKNQKKKPKRSSSSSTTTAEGDDVFYYYYSGFGPWRSKRRSGASDNSGGCDIHEIEAHEVEVDVDHMFDEEGPVAGDDEEDNEDDRGMEWGDHKITNNCRGEAKEEERNNFRKRGRKPVKARSLKSLL